MKRIIFGLVFGIMALVSFTSCMTADAVVCDEPTIDVVIRYGTPYYYNGAIVYYVYDNYYYYPHYNGTRWYYYRDRRPIRPHHNGWVNPGTQKPHRHHGNPPHDKPGTVKPNHNGHSGHGGHSGGNVGRPGGSRPSGGGHHGGNGGRPSTPRRR